MSKPLERSCGRGIRSSMPKAAISDSGFGMTVATEAGQSGHFRRSSNPPQILSFGLGRKVPNSDIAFGNGRVTFR